MKKTINWILEHTNFICMCAVLVVLCVVIVSLQRGCNEEGNVRPLPPPTPTPPLVVVIDTEKQEIIISCLELMLNTPLEDREQVWLQGTSRIRLNPNWEEILAPWDAQFKIGATEDRIAFAIEHFRKK